jgi:hypothetical protein
MSNWQVVNYKCFPGKSRSIVRCLLPVACWLLPIAYFFTACSASKSSFSPAKKYSPEQLQKDYDLYRSILETHHPSLYWYTSKDSMDHYFSWGKEQLKDSMTEPGFRKVLAYVTSKINCGHTSVRTSKAWSKYSDTVRAGRMFPLSVKAWDEATVVTANLNRRDSILKRGTQITSINGRTMESLIDTMFNFISTDGYNLTHKYQSLSNRGYFGSLYGSIFGLPERYAIGYKDSTGQQKITTIPVYRPSVDTAQRGTRSFRPTTPQPSKRERKRQEAANTRLLKIDSVNHTAMMDLSSFGRGYGLKKFFRNSFRALKNNKIGHLIIDVRSNGGGSVTNSTFLSRYIARQRFKVSDSLYAIKKGSPYQQYIQDQFWNRLFMTFFTKRKKDGYYHFGYFERHAFKPKNANHFDGKVYILTGGNSFSATTLFVSAVIRQENVIVIGEETGGGAYGNSAWLIPDATLPETGVRFRLPLFRLVIDETVPKNGKGVQPEVPSLPTVEAVKKGLDYKLDKALELINKDKEANRQ